MVRVKALALLVGTAGMGIAGLYLSAVDVLCTVSGMGIAVSGVRHIAATEDEQQRASTIVAVRRLALVLGLLGSAVGLVLSPWFAEIAFGAELEPHHAVGMAIVSLAVLLRNASTGQVAVLQGLRKVAEMAAAKVLGALLGAIMGIAVVWISGLKRSQSTSFAWPVVQRLGVGFSHGDMRPLPRQATAPHYGNGRRRSLRPAVLRWAVRS